ncbi:MAG: RES family NAD+ phosphorylase [Stellaceae bacterium]
MVGIRRIHDRGLLDALEALDPEPFSADVWRVTRKGRDPLRGSITNGRWSPNAEFEVLYTSVEREGALAEIGYRLSLEPVWPSQIEHEIHLIGAEIDRIVRLAKIESLIPLGIDIARYQTLEYEATQAVAAASYFLEFDGMLVPSARFACLNLVIFTERAGDLTLKDSQAVDWDSWRRERRQRQIL